MGIEWSNPVPGSDAGGTAGPVRRERADVLVVGGGISAAMAAIAARQAGLDVLLVDRGFFGRTGCSSLASGMFSYYRPEDGWDYWLSNHGGTMVNQRLLKEAIAFQGKLVHDLERWGVEWVKEGGPGSPIARMGGPGIPFPHSAMMVGGGPKFMMSVRAHVLSIGVRVLDRTFVTELLTSDGCLPTAGRVTGALGMNTRTGAVSVLEASATVMATGPVHFPYPRPDGPFTGMPIELSGDGVAMGLRVGAELGKMEIGGDGLVQQMFHAAQGFEMLLGLGGRLVNARGEDFLKTYAETGTHGSGARRSSLGNASIREIVAGRGPILRDSRDLGADDIRLLDLVIPIVMRTFRAAGIDVDKAFVPYIRALVGSSAVSGAGLHVQPDGRTSVTGLFAAGNTTDGAYVVMGQNLSTCAVLGYWAGRSLERFVSAAGPPVVDDMQVQRTLRDLQRPAIQEGALTYADVHRQVEQILLEVGYVMSAERLDRALDRLGPVRARALDQVRAVTARDRVKLAGLRNYCQVLDAAYRVMRHRTESRGNVLRSDFPYTDNVDWLCMTRAKLRADGTIQLWDVRRPDGSDYRPVARAHSPHPFFV